MNVSSEAVLAAFPLLAVATGDETPAAAQHGIRYLVGRQGIAREVSLPWIKVRSLIAPTHLPLPYGNIEETVEFRCGLIPIPVVREFIDDAKEALPNEIAGVFLWNEASGDWRYQRRQATSAGHAHVHYVEVQPGDGEHIVVDVHSHGCHPAFFSDEDDRDDAGAMKLSLVLGNLDQARPTSKMRLCMAGVLRPAYLNGTGSLGVCP